MILKRLQLTNFRNYSNLSLDFDLRPTILLGNNAVGKSNLLESIYLLSTTKSQRAELDSELIKEGEEFARVQGTAISEHSESELEIGFQLVEGNFSKRLKVNGVPRRAVDLIGNLPAVIFYPSDINMVTGSPSLRRWHLDLGLAQIDTEYKKVLTLFEQVLTNRNRVLKRIKEGEGGMDELTFWTGELLKQGQVVSGKRKAFFEFLKSLKKPLGNFEFEYHENILSQERLEQYSGREIAAAATLIGPHRDDFRIFTFVIPSKEGIHINSESGSPIGSGMTGKRNLAHFGSRGEQRTATLAFKLSQLEFMAEKLGKRPVLLLDDVFSELDAKHRKAILDIVKLQQTILATVELEHIPKTFLDEARVLKVDNGKITE
jgi:DNA replication and repair protein RecF